jgi:hypothetical protein
MIPSIIQPLFGKTCCKARVWRGRSFRLGFGEKTYHGNPRLIDDFYGEWELGTYRNSWRVIKNGKVICGSNDTVDAIEELDASIKQLTFGKIISLTQERSEIDFRIQFDTGIIVEFLCTVSDEEETLHIFCPDDVCVTFDVVNGWLIEKLHYVDGNVIEKTIEPWNQEP